MRGPDRRGTVRITGIDPADAIEEEPGVDTSYTRAYLVEVDIALPLSIGSSSPVGHYVQFDVDSIFKARGGTP